VIAQTTSAALTLSMCLYCVTGWGEIDEKGKRKKKKKENQ
jgi:hypothetical protein